MFLKIDGAKSGAIKGEAADTTHKDEIDVVGWSWGMRSQTDMASGGAASKATLREISFRKKVDSASVALMSALRNNEPIKKALLTVRKAGKQPLEYVKITMENGRITSLDIDSVEGGESSDLLERLTLSFQKIEVEYVPQGEDGAPRGSMVFQTETV